MSASQIGNPFTYTGRRLDEESDLYYYRARHYSSDLKRFVQRDPLEYVDGPNVYAYVGGEPVGVTDPMGLERRSEGRAGDECQCLLVRQYAKKRMGWKFGSYVVLPLGGGVLGGYAGYKIGGTSTIAGIGAAFGLVFGAGLGFWFDAEVDNTLATPCRCGCGYDGDYRNPKWDDMLRWEAGK